MKWDHLKQYMGYAKLKDIFLTMTAGIGGDDLDIHELNELGLVFDFTSHRLGWRSEFDQIFYEIKT